MPCLRFEGDPACETYLEIKGLEFYERDVAKLCESTLENPTYGVDRVSGTVSIDKNKILCVTIPYAKGWHAFVDGVETQVYPANEHYIGVALAPGEHKVDLVYTPPYKRAGAALSLLGIMIFAVHLVVDLRKSGDRRRRI